MVSDTFFQILNLRWLQYGFHVKFCVFFSTRTSIHPSTFFSFTMVAPG